MKYDMDQELIGYDGEAITEGDDNSPVVLGKVLMAACVNANPQTYKTGKEKLKIYRLLQRISAGGEIELQSEQITLLKDLVGAVYGVGMVGAVYDVLEKAEPH